MCKHVQGICIFTWSTSLLARGTAPLTDRRTTPLLSHPFVCSSVTMAASSSRPQKLAKLQQSKANLPHHSQTSLHAMIAEAKKTGLPDYSSPKEQRDARRFLLNQCDGGAMGPVLPGCLPRSVGIGCSTCQIHTKDLASSHHALPMKESTSQSANWPLVC